MSQCCSHGCVTLEYSIAFMSSALIEYDAFLLLGTTFG